MNILNDLDELATFLENERKFKIAEATHKVFIKISQNISNPNDSNLSAAAKRYKSKGGTWRKEK